MRLLLLAALAGEHLLLLGPPGTAKSELARRMARLTGGSYYERLLTRFSVPEELFGPLSMKGGARRHVGRPWPISGIESGFDALGISWMVYSSVLMLTAAQAQGVQA